LFARLIAPAGAIGNPKEPRFLNTIGGPKAPVNRVSLPQLQGVRAKMHVSFALSGLFSTEARLFFSL
jgi:hypothetical protein